MLRDFSDTPVHGSPLLPRTPAGSAKLLLLDSPPASRSDPTPVGFWKWRFRQMGTLGNLDEKNIFGKVARKFSTENPFIFRVGSSFGKNNISRKGDVKIERT